MEGSLSLTAFAGCIKVARDTVYGKREAGGISSRNSKMPGSSYALPPSKCQTGAKLMQVEGSTCHKCYAVKSERMYTVAPRQR